MVVGRLVEIGRQAAIRYGPTIVKVVNAQDRILDKAYKSSRISKPIRYGVRHGLAVGSIIGTYITDGGGDGDSAPIPQKPKYVKTYKQNKTRNRYTGRCRDRQSGTTYPCTKYRYSNSRKY